MCIFHDWKYSYEDKKYYESFGFGVFYKRVQTRVCKKCGKTEIKVKG